MISIEECKKYLEEDGIELSDEETEKLRDIIYTLVHQVVDDLFSVKIDDI